MWRHLQHQHWQGHALPGFGMDIKCVWCHFFFQVQLITGIATMGIATAAGIPTAAGIATDGIATTDIATSRYCYC